MGRVIRAERGSRVVPAPVADARVEARALLEGARRRIAELERSAQERARAEAKAELAAGYLQLAQARATERAHLERQLTELSLVAARKLLGAQLSLAPERIRDVIAPLLAKLRGATRVTLVVHPDDEPAVRRWLAPDAEPHAPVDVQTSVDMVPGGCIVDSDIGTLDARVETRLAALARAFEDEQHDR